jgi:septal ring factor EnvC (AmiA/AmiB activator)
MKVVRLLQDTKVELEKELEDDKAVHELMDCWCKTGTEEKEAAIEAGKAKIAQLESSMAEAVAKIKELKAKRKETLDEVNADHKALVEAEALRMKENQAYQASSTDLMEAIDACKNAVIVLGKENNSSWTTAFTQVQVQSVARRLLAPRVSALVDHSGAISRKNAELLREFMRKAQTTASFLSIPGFQSYAPQSGQIYGILQQMQADFEADLGESEKIEAKAVKDFDMMKAAKEDEIDTGRKLIVSIDSQIADTEAQYAEEFKELKNTEKQLAWDEEFLKNLKEKCATSDADYEKRVKDRMAEIEAVTDTIAILNNNESFEVFDKMVAPAPMFIQTFVQKTFSAQQQMRKRAVSVLQGIDKLDSSPKVALLMVSAQLDAFTKVKAMIDKMVVELQTQQQDEIAFRDMCIKDLNENKRDTEMAYDKKDSLETKIADLEKEIETLTKDIDAAKATIAETELQMKRGSDNREGENAEFQATVNDHVLMTMILEKAIDRMKEVYALMQQGKPGAPHIQTSGNHTDPGNGPAAFKKYSENAGGSRVVTMLEEIKADTHKTLDQAHASEQDSQSAYENFMKDSNKAILQLQQSISDMTAARATAKEDLSIAESDLKQTVADLEALHTTNGDLHKSCDYTLKISMPVRRQERRKSMP